MSLKDLFFSINSIFTPYMISPKVVLFCMFVVARIIIVKMKIILF